MTRVYNFSAGPAVLPLPVLEEAQRDLVALPGVGMSVMEISHRSKAFDEIIHGAEAEMRTLGGIPDNYKVLFLQGGASLQFSMVPMNLLTPGATADYIITGDWAKKALKEAKKVGTTAVAATTESGRHQADSQTGRADVDPERRVRPHDVEQHALRHPVALAAGHGRRTARLRLLVGHVFAADRRLEIRAHLCGRPEESRPVGRDRRDRAGGPAGPIRRRACRRC